MNLALMKMRLRMAIQTQRMSSLYNRTGRLLKATLLIAMPIVYHALLGNIRVHLKKFLLFRGRVSLTLQLVGPVTAAVEARTIH